MTTTAGSAENTIDRPTATPTPKPARKKRKPAAPTRVTLQIVPTGTVNVCLVDANGRTLINSETLEAGQQTRRYRGRRFRVTFGNGQARMRAGEPHDRRPGSLDAGRLRGAPRQAPARAVRGAAADLP